MDEIARKVVEEFGESVKAERIAWSYPDGEEPIWTGYHFIPRNPLSAEVKIFFNLGIRLLSPPSLDLEDWDSDDATGPMQMIRRIGLFGIHYTRWKFPFGSLTPVVPKSAEEYDALAHGRSIPRRHHCPW